MKTPEPENREFEIPLIGRLIDVRLKARLQDEDPSAASTVHPDDDVIAAFVEGRLAEAESVSIVSHLVNCASCLHLTAHLIRFESEETTVDSISTTDQERDPGPFRGLLDRLAAGAALSREDAVFAYEEKKEESADGEPEAKSDSQT